MGKIFSIEDADNLMQIVEREELCVFPDQQTFDCQDCTICRIEYKRRLLCGEIELAK